MNICLQRMKHLSIYFHKSFLLFVLLSIFASCEQESMIDNPTQVETKTVRLTASMEEEHTPSTNTVLSEYGQSVLWNAHDQIKVFTKNNVSGTLFESMNDTPSKNANFEGVLDISGISAGNPLYAVYPYSAAASFDGTSITTALASEQTAMADGFADHLLPAIAVSTDMNLSFYQVATGIRFMISTEGVKKVIFRGNKGEIVAGNFKVSLNAENRPEVTDVIDGSQWVTLTAPENDTFEVGKMYYLSVLPQTFENGFTLTFLTNTDAARFEFKNEVLFKQALWKNGNNLEEGIVYTTQLLSNGLPIVEVNVQDGEMVDSKETWKECSIRIGQDYYDSVLSDGKIRGRGNATWNSYPKKPYRIKFAGKESPFGFSPNKDWVLLAQYNDKSLLREAYMSEVSKAVGCEYSINYQHVNLYLNNEYLGVYLLTDQVKTGKNRVNVENDGFLIEEDLYYNYEPLWFTTGLGYNYTFKYPDAGDGEIVSGDDSFNFILDYLNNVETALFNVSSNPEQIATLIDLNSFAKWFLIQELMGNWEPNRFYVLHSRISKLKMYPAWDAEWSLGLAQNGNPDNQWGWYYPPELPRVDSEIMAHKYYFPYLMQSSDFIAEVKAEWQSLKPHLPEIVSNIQSVASTLVKAQKDNFDKWPILNEYTSVGLIALGSWEAEVEYVQRFFNDRAMYIDNYINSL